MPVGLSPKHGSISQTTRSLVAHALAFEKGLESLARGVCFEPAFARALLLVVAAAPVQADVFVHQPLDALHHARVVGANHARRFKGAVAQPGAGDELVEQADAFCLKSAACLLSC